MSDARALPAAADLTDDGFLGGRLRILQPKAGHRAGIDAVMLAAAVPAKQGDRVLEAGIGVGAAALCLAARVSGVMLTGVEVDAAVAGIAVENARRNGFADRVRVEQADVAAPGKAMRGAGLGPESFDHAYANPPFHAEKRVRAPRDPARARANVHGPGDLDAWARFLVASVKPGGTVSMILPASSIGEALALFARRLGDLRIFPLYPRAAAPASRVIVRGVKGSRAAPSLLPGLVLHGSGNAFTEEAEAVLRHGAALNL